MPSLDRSQNILGASANYQAADWGSVGAAGSLDARLTAELKRGVDLDLGVEALVALDASLRKFLTVEASGQAHAAARVRAQVQVPLDLFDECGAAIRLHAAAEAAAGIQLALGLSIGDFLDLAERDPRLRGAPARLLRVFLEELTVRGGVAAKVAVSAMAYASVAMTGRLVPIGRQSPGFTVAGEFGLGLEAGAGFRVFADFAVEDPRRLVRRSVDIAVEECLTAMAALLPEPGQAQILEQLRAPAKAALRATFEVGLTLTESGGAFSAGAGPRLAQRCLQTVLEEAQRFLLEQLGAIGLRTVGDLLTGLASAAGAWDRCRPEREALATRLEALPPDPFDLTPETQKYWLELSDGILDLGSALVGDDASAEWVEPAAVVWAATQLMLVAVRRISEASARASIIGLAPAEASRAFGGSLPADAPPRAIGDLINRVLERASGAALRQEDLLAFLLRGPFVQRLVDEVPAVAPLLSIFRSDAATDLGDLASIVLGNIGAFPTAAAGPADPVAGLRAVLAGLRRYVDGQVREQVDPLLEAVARTDPVLRTYVDEVLLSTLGFAVDVVFERVLEWSEGDQGGQTALREACSAVLMRLFARSLVVTADVVLQRAFDGIGGALRDAAAHVDDPGGVVPVLAQATQLPRADLAETTRETLLACATAFGPLPAAQRDRIRALLYQLLDTAPTVADDTFVDSLADAAMVPNLQAATDLALTLGGLLGARLTQFVGALLTLLAEKVLEALADAIEAAEQQIREWIAALEQLGAAVAQRLLQVAEDVRRLAAEADAAADQALGEAERLFGLFDGTSAGRAALRTAVRSCVLEQASAAVAAFPGYDLLAGEAKKQVQGVLEDVVGGLTATLVDPLLETVATNAPAAQQVLQRLRALRPGDDLVEEITDIALDQVEGAARAAFGSRDPVVPLGFKAPIDYQPPVGPRVQFTFEVNVGSVRIPLGDLLRGLRTAAAQLSALEDVAQDLAAAVEKSLVAAANRDAAKAEQAALRTEDTTTRQRLAETKPAQLDARIDGPRAGGMHTAPVGVTLTFAGVSRSYVGLEDGEQQRILVWLNEKPVAPGRFTVDTVEADRPAAPRDADRPPARRDADRSDLREQVRTGGTPRPDVVVTPPNLLGVLPGVDVQIGTIAPNVAAARLLRLRTTLTAGELRQGVNTLTVAVLSGRNQRVRRSISFGVAPASPVPAGPGVSPRPRRPGRGRAPQDVPASLRRLVAEQVASLEPADGDTGTVPVGNGAGVPAGDRPMRLPQERAAALAEQQERLSAAIRVIDELERAIVAGRARPVVGAVPAAP